MQTTIFNETMSRVRRIHRIRAFISSPISKVGGAFVLLAIVSSFVSYSQVIQNMPSIFNLRHFLSFAGIAFANTEFSVQVVSLVSMGLLLFAIRDSLNHLRPRHFRVG